MEYANAQSMRIFNIVDQSEICELTEKVFRNYFTARQSGHMAECFRSLWSLHLPNDCLNERFVSTVLRNFEKYFEIAGEQDDPSTHMRWAQWNLRAARCLLKS